MSYCNVFNYFWDILWSIKVVRIECQQLVMIWVMILPCFINIHVWEHHRTKGNDICFKHQKNTKYGQTGLAVTHWRPYGGPSTWFLEIIRFERHDIIGFKLTGFSTFGWWSSLGFFCVFCYCLMVHVRFHLVSIILIMYTCCPSLFVPLNLISWL